MLYGLDPDHPPDIPAHYFYRQPSNCMFKLMVLFRKCALAVTCSIIVFVKFTDLKGFDLHVLKYLRY